MKIHVRFTRSRSLRLAFTVLLGFAAPGLIPPAAAATADARVQLQETPSLISLGNNRVRVEVDPKSFEYSIIDARDGTVAIANAHGEVDGIGGEKNKTFVTRNVDPAAKRTWTVTAIADDLGTGKTLTLRTRRSDNREIFTTITVRDGQGFIALGSGMVNHRNYGIRVMSFQPLVSGDVFPGLEKSNPMTLNGGAGSTRNVVLAGTQRACANSVLLTFTANGQRRSLVMGGLSYSDFAKYTALGKSQLWDGYPDSSKPELGRTWQTVWRDIPANKITKGEPVLGAQVAAIDPVGRLVDPGTTYQPNDLFYIDVTTDDPFAALESYGRALRTATQARPNVYNNLTVCGWFSNRNTSALLVNELKIAQKLDMLKTIPVAVRLEPDTYCGEDNGNTEQGWWDDAHWVKYGHLVPPYDTFQKWCQAVKAQGGTAETYFQCGMPSDDYAEAFPGHMLNNDISRLHRSRTHVHPMAIYDPTDVDFQKHMGKVWANLKDAGLAGVKFDYPDVAWNASGGFENKYATTASAYRQWFQLCRDGLGTEALIHERALGAHCLDVTAGIVDMQRTWGDSELWLEGMAGMGGLRWYKNRVVMSYYPDSKSFIYFDEKGKGDPKQPMAALQRRAIITMLYVTSGRIESARSLETLTPEVVYDLGRAFPMHTAAQSARPVDAFTGAKTPAVYAFRVDAQWQQVTLYNEGKTAALISAPLSGEQAGTGSLALDPAKHYYIYEFWSDRLVGKVAGSGKLSETLAAGEARMYAVREVLAQPQVLSTNRHLMQGYVDLANIKWDAAAKQLSGTAQVIGGEAFRIVVAGNGAGAKNATATGAQAKVEAHPKEAALSVIVLERPTNGEVAWKIQY